MTGETRSWSVHGVITALALRESGGAVVALTTGIHLLDFETGGTELLSPLADPPTYVFNDGKVDRQGRFVIGATTADLKQPTPHGGLYRLNPDHSFARLDSGIHISNGPCWSPDDKTFYFADSWQKTVYAYDYDIVSGAVANRRVFVNTSDLGGLPDGATVDRDGLLWTAVYGSGKVAAFRPDGRLERIVELPVKLVSSVMFGGANLDLLYVTTLKHGIFDEPVEDGAGDVLVIEGLGTSGLPEPRYGG